MYATPQDMIDRYGQPRMVQLTDVGMPMTGDVVAAVLEARLADASAEIDGYLAGRMATPVANPPAILRLLCCRLAYALLLGAQISDQEAGDVRDARAYLMSVSRGQVLLAPPAQAATPSMPADAVVFEPGQKVMGREAW